jgi:hypothetical protein
MSTSSSSFLSIILGLAATFLGLAILVQVTQELWKHLTSSKANAYKQLLFDFFGLRARPMFEPGALRPFQVRGPFQFLRRRPIGKLLPLEKPQLIAALEHALPEWHRRALVAICYEAKAQAGTPSAPSPAWMGFRAQLAAAEPLGPGSSIARDINRFLDAWATGEQLNAAALLTAYRTALLPHIQRADDDYQQLSAQFDFAYRRKNLRQTVTIAFLISFFFNMPIGQLYRHAAAASPESAAQAARDMMQLYQTTGGLSTDSLGMAKARQLADKVLTSAAIGQQPLAQWQGLSDFVALVQAGGGPLVGYVLGCLVTTLLVSFGAPFWNDVAQAVLRTSQPERSASDAATGLTIHATGVAS